MPSEEVILEHGRRHRLRFGIRRFESDGALRFVARRVAESAREKSACQLDMVLRLFRMQHREFPELGERRANVAGVQFRLADGIEADMDAGIARQLADRGPSLFELGRSETPLAG